MVSSKLTGEMVAMMVVFVRPPRESCSSRVSFDSLRNDSAKAIQLGFHRTEVAKDAPVGDVGLFLDELVDDAAEREETGVDHAGFAGATLLGATPPDIL